ncbi:hypothetical protein INR49_005728 [Caranx melampygus]|nr:hypothetical protein INR49_005728 [Caranx melampygus]
MKMENKAADENSRSICSPLIGSMSRESRPPLSTVLRQRLDQRLKAAPVTAAQAWWSNQDLDYHLLLLDEISSCTSISTISGVVASSSSLLRPAPCPVGFLMKKRLVCLFVSTEDTGSSTSDHWAFKSEAATAHFLSHRTSQQPVAADLHLPPTLSIMDKVDDDSLSAETTAVHVNRKQRVLGLSGPVCVHGTALM